VTVLILARDLKASADRLVQALGEREVPVFRTDLAAFPQELTLDARLGPSGWDGVLATEHRELRSQTSGRCSIAIRRTFSCPTACPTPSGVMQSTTHSITRWWNHPSSHQRSQTVLTDATKLTPQEEQTARSHLRRLVEQLTADGTLCCPEWREVFQRTWRHPYVPRFYTGCGSGPLVSAADGHHRSQWLTAGYSDESLITKMVPTPPVRPGGSPVRPRCRRRC